MKIKMLVTLTRLESRWVPFDVTAHRLRGNFLIADDVASLMSTATAGIPKRCRKMQVGDIWTLQLAMEVNYSTDYWGEHDMEVSIVKCKVLKKRKAK